MAKLYLNLESDWGQASPFRKRFQGFVCYLICAFYSLLWPEATDMALYSILKKQFIEPGSEIPVSTHKVNR